MPTTYEPIQRNTYLIVAILVASFATVSLAFVWQEIKIDETQDRNAQYHLPTIVFAFGIKEELLRLQQRLSALANRVAADVPTEDPGRGRVALYAQRSLHAIRTDLRSIVALQDTFGDARFDRTIEKIQSQINALSGLSETRSWPQGDAAASELGKRVGALILSASQLERLHLIAHDQTVRRIEADLSRRNFIVAPLALGVLLCGVLALAYLTSQTRRALIRLDEADRSLRESEQRFRAVVDNLPSSVALKDLEGRYLLANRRFLAWYLRPGDRLVGKTAHDVFPADQADRIAALDRRVLETRGIVEQELAVPHGDGTIHTEMTVLFPILDAGGRPVGTGVVGTDITERDRLEQALRQTQKMEAIGQLTGGVAHDFNNLLAVILGNTELLGEQVGKDDPMVESVLRAASRGAELTQRLLAFSRKQALQPAVIDLNASIGSMSEMLRRTLGETVEIETVRADALWTCEADPGQLENAILNLALNARDAMPEGGRLTIETANARLDADYAGARSEVSPGRYVMLAVTDTGCGMPPEILEHVFEPFFTTKEVGRGSGLGLSMVYGFAKQSGGHVAVYTEEGQGTTVKLYLPKSAKQRQAPEPAEIEETPRAHGETVLIVEDDADVRSLAVRLLRELGYRTLPAEDGAAAIERMESCSPIDLLLTDLVMPGGMDGTALAREALRRHPGIRILYMSGYTENAIVHQGKLDDGVLLVQKPFRKADLARMLRRALAQPASFPGATPAE